MSEIRAFFNAMVQELREQRSELEPFVRSDVKGVRTEISLIWTRLEAHWWNLQDRNAKMQSMTSEAVEDMRLGVQRLIIELQEGYRRLRKALRGATEPTP